MDLGSVNAPPPLEHRDSGVGWSIVERKILCMNTTLAATVRAVKISVKQQATSYRQKSQASSSC